MKRKGFSLMEMILVCAILSVVLATFSSVMVSSSKVYNKSTNFAYIQNQSLIFQRLMTNQVGVSSAVQILEAVPTTFDENTNYIYLDESDNIIKVKKEDEEVEELFHTENIEQNVQFTKKDDSNISVVLTLTRRTDSYNNKFGINVLNAEKNGGVSGTVGNCLAYTFADEEPFITRFDFKKDENGELLTTDAIGTIDQTTGEISVRVTTDNITSLKASVDIVGDTLKVYSENGTLFDISNPIAIDYTNPVDFYVFAGSNIKKYTVTVEPEESIPQVQLDPALGIIPTSNGKKNEIPNESDIVMPNDEQYLNAMFELNNSDGSRYENYEVNWYTIDPSNVDSYQELLDEYIKYTDDEETSVELVATIDDNNVIDVSAYREELVGKYVFYDVTPVSEDGSIGRTEVSLGDTEPNVDSETGGYLDFDDYVCSFVFVGLKNGEIYETTLNELDFLCYDLDGYDSDGNAIQQSKSQYDMKQNIVICEFNQMGVKLKSKYYDNTDSSVNGIVKLDTFINDFVKVIAPYENKGHTYDVDFINKEMTMTGSSIQVGANNQNSIDNYNDVGTNKYGQYGLFSINMYDDYYSDKREDIYDSGVRVGIKNDVLDYPEIGGVAIAPNVTSSYGYNWSTNKDDHSVVYNNGLYVNMIYNKNTEPYPEDADDNSDKSIFNRGVNMNYSTGETIYGNYGGIDNVSTNDSEAMTGQALVGARNISKRNGNLKNALTPYLFTELTKDGYTISRSEPNNLYIDSRLTIKNSKPLYTVDIYNANDTSQKTQKMYFGWYKDVLNKDTGIYTMDNGIEIKTTYDTYDNNNVQASWNGSDTVDMKTDVTTPGTDWSGNEVCYDTSFAMWSYYPDTTKARVTITDIESIN